jgi:hypothetical protein
MDPFSELSMRFSLEPKVPRACSVRGWGFSILACGSGDNGPLAVTGCELRESIQDELEMRDVLEFAIERQI